MAGYMPGYSSLMEIIASRYHYILNGCEYSKETCVPMIVRPVGWGCRLAFFMFSVVFLLMAMARDINPLNQYGFSRERDAEGTLVNDDTDAFEWYVVSTYVVWVVSILTEVLSYLVGRGGGGKAPHQGQCSAFPMILCNRVSLSGDARCLNGMILLVWFLGFGVAASTMLYTTMCHMFVKRNLYFSWLFVVFIVSTVLSTLADAISLGGIDGLAVQNRPASYLAALRVVVIVPLLLFFSVFFLFMCSPPWNSI